MIRQDDDFGVRDAGPPTTESLKASLTPQRNPPTISFLGYVGWSFGDLAIRFHFDDARRHRRVTKILPRLMRAGGVDIGHTAAADVAARLFGYADRRELDACIGRTPASLWDEDEAPASVALRRSRQAKVLQEAGLTPDAAASLLDGFKPTARDFTGRPRTRAVRPKDQATPEMASSVRFDAILDRWDRAAYGSCTEAFENLVRETYDAGFEWLSLYVASDVELWVAYGFHGEGGKVVGTIPARMGARIMKWIGTVGKLHRVDHGNAMIPFVVESIVPEGFTGRLQVNRRTPPPALEAYGIERQAEWIDALASRPGLHVMCCPEGFGMYLRRGYGRIAETLAHSLADTGVGVFRRTSGRAAMDALRSGPGEIRALEPRLPGGKSHSATPSDLMVVSFIEAPTPLFPEVVSSNNSVLWLATGTPEWALERLLMDRLPSDWLRRNLLSVAYRTDTPQPHSPANKLGFNECGGMRWSVEVLKPSLMPV